MTQKKMAGRFRPHQMLMTLDNGAGTFGSPDEEAAFHRGFDDAHAKRQRALDKDDWSNEGSAYHDGYSSVINCDLANPPPQPDGQHGKPRWTGLPHESFVSTGYSVGNADRGAGRTVIDRILA